MDQGQMPLFDNTNSETGNQKSEPDLVDGSINREIKPEKPDITASLTYTRWMQWEQVERKKLGLPAEYAIPAPPGLLEIMTNENPESASSFEFDNWQLIMHDDDVFVVPYDYKQTEEPVEASHSDNEYRTDEHPAVLRNHQGECLLLPSPWDENIQDRILCKQAQIERAQQDEQIHVMLDFVNACLKGFNIVDVTGFSWELQYIHEVEPGKNDVILLRSNLSANRRLALLCILIDLITNPDEFYTLSGIPA